MTFRGHIQNGQVVLDEPANLADGTPVTISPTATPSSKPEDIRALWDGLLKLAGTVDGPSDLAENHDHYAHGAPKRRPR